MDNFLDQYSAIINPKKAQNPYRQAALVLAGKSQISLLLAIIRRPGPFLGSILQKRYNNSDYYIYKA